MKKMLPLVFVLFTLSLITMVGCSKLQKKGTLDESSLDASLKQAAPASAPDVDPGSPQPQFDQQPLQAQNL